MRVPQRSADERAQALVAALATRQERARLRDALRSRELTGVDIIQGASTNRIWANLKVAWLLESLPGVGVVRAERIMASVRIASSRRIRGLGVHQRTALVLELEREGR